MRFRILLVAGALVALGLGPLAPVRADDAPATTRVPAVQGQTLEEAVRVLEAAGLHVAVIESAGPTVGIVSDQEPPAGTTLPRAEVVFVRVGIKARIMTTLPSVDGKGIEAALEMLESAYDVRIQPVRGADHQQGKVLRTEPRGGSRVLFRGPVVIHVVDNAGAAARADGTPEVPPPPAVPTAPPAGIAEDPLLGEGGPSDALLPPPRIEPGSTQPVEPPTLPAPPTQAPPGIPPSQELLPPGVPSVDAPLATEPPRLAPPGPGTSTLPSPRIAVPLQVPELRGLTLADATAQILAAGLTPRPWFRPAPDGVAPLAVHAQKNAAGTRLARGTQVHFRVAPLAPDATHAPAPALVGLPMTDAIAILSGLRLRIRVDGSQGLVPPRTRIAAQAVAPGTVLARGTSIPVTMEGAAGAPPAGQPTAPMPPTAPGVADTPAAPRATRPAPDLVGLTRAEAEARARAAGVPVRIVPGTSGEAAPGRIYEQSPPAGMPLAVGLAIEARESTVPLAAGRGLYARVPDVVGHSPAVAEATMNGAGLRAVIEDRSVGGAIRRVVAQSHHPGALMRQGAPVVLVVESAPGAPGSTAPAAPPSSRDRADGPLDEAGRFFRKTHKKVWRGIKGLFR